MSLFQQGFILPLTDNDGNSLAALHADLKADLAATFGGYTATAAHGGWIDGGQLYEDHSFFYTIASRGDQKDKIREIAYKYGAKAGQICVLLMWRGGEVEFLDIAESDRESNAA